MKDLLWVAYFVGALSAWANIYDDAPRDKLGSTVIGAAIGAALWPFFVVHAHRRRDRRAAGGRRLVPIQPENRGRYPADWPAISARIRYERAGNKCEACGVENHALGGRDPYGRFLTAWPTGDNGLRLTWPKPGDLAWCGPQEAPRRLRIIRIVLTVAHLDNTPENCADENLRAWCQRCHLNYDRHIHVANRRRNAFRRRAVADLFAELAPA